MLPGAHSSSLFVVATSASSGALTFAFHDQRPTSGHFAEYNWLEREYLRVTVAEFRTRVTVAGEIF